MSKYFILKNSKKYGPLSFDQLKKYKINKTDLIWKEGTESWIKAKELPELSQIIQQELPKTPFEKKSEQTLLSLKVNFVVPFIVGIIMGSIAIYSWSSVKSKAYASNTERHTYSSGDILIPYEKFMDKYLGGENGYGLRRDNEDYYYSITNGNVSVLTDKYGINSDVDFIVDFESVEINQNADNYYDFKFSLENIFHRRIDILEEKAIKNPYFLQVVNTQLQLLIDIEIKATSSEKSKFV